MAEHVKKTQNAFVRMFIPNKKDNTAAKIRKTVVILCLLVFVGCGIYILADFTDRQADNEMNNEIVNIKEMNASGNFKNDGLHAKRYVFPCIKSQWRNKC